MKKYINKKIIIFLCCFIFIIILFVFIFFNPFLYIKTNSKKTIKLNINEKFKMPDVSAYLFKYNMSDNIVKKGKVDNTQVGVYELNYTIKYLFTTKTLSIKVNVLDTEKPIIELNGENNIILCPGKKYEEEGYSASDNYDGDITDKVKVELLEDSIKYSVKDESGNSYEIKRNFMYEDKGLPIITLNGSQYSKITLNSNYKDNGYKASDNCDGDITSNVEVINNVNTSKIGSYVVTYKVKDSSGNEVSVNRNVDVVNNDNGGFYTDIVMGPTYINGILIVNKKYALPKNYGNGVDSEAYTALVNLQNTASSIGYSIPLLSGYRSYSFQSTLYNNYVRIDGQALADTYSARPGHSEHQTGLAFDVGKLDDYYGETPEGIWLKNNAHNFGFIIRYPKGKEHITGYQYEPWHIRYLGVYHATEIYNKGITLEEYLGLS